MWTSCYRGSQTNPQISCGERKVLASLCIQRSILLTLFAAASYGTSKSDVPYFSYFASTTPDSDSKRVRLKTALFLQGSKLYDAAAVFQRLDTHEHKKVLSFELAVVLGKVRPSPCPHLLTLSY